MSKLLYSGTVNDKLNAAVHFIDVMIPSFRKTKKIVSSILSLWLKWSTAKTESLPSAPWTKSKP